MKNARLGLLLSVLAFEVTSCSHPTGSPTSVPDTIKHIDTTSHFNVDTIHYHFASVTVHGLGVMEIRNDNSVIDTVNASFERTDTFPKTLAGWSGGMSWTALDSLGIQQQWGASEYTSGIASWGVTLQRDSSQKLFTKIHVEYSSSSDISQGQIENVNRSDQSYDLVNIPYTMASDNSLSAHIPLVLQLSHLSAEIISNSESSTSKFGTSSGSTSVSLIRVDSCSSDAFIEILLKP